MNLDRNDVHLWITRLGGPINDLEEFYRTLSHDEMLRANAYRFEKDRAAFISARGLLRLILGRYVGQEPEKIGLRYGSEGKPSLLAASEPMVYFNLSHSEEYVIYAFTKKCELGVDLECLKDWDVILPTVEDCLAAEEYRELSNLVPTLRDQAFFNCWTRKEAYLKAVGCGLSASMEKIRVSLAPGEPARFVNFENERPTSGWTLLHLDPIPGYVGALAIPAVPSAIRQFKFSRAGECLRFLRANN